MSTVITMVTATVIVGIVLIYNKTKKEHKRAQLLKKIDKLISSINSYKELYDRSETFKEREMCIDKIKLIALSVECPNIYFINIIFRELEECESVQKQSELLNSLVSHIMLSLERERKHIIYM